MNWNPGRAVLAGFAGTTAMTMLMLLAPSMGLPAMNIGAMLGSVMGGNVALGWAAHLMIGVLLALGYASLFSARLPGPAPVRGAIFSLAPWLMSQLIVMPMMGLGLFSGSAPAALGSLMGHLLYGTLLGLVVGGRSAAQPAAHAVRA